MNLENAGNQEAQHACCGGNQAACPPSRLGRTLMAVGLGGAALSVLCCVAPFLLAGILAAIGLSFILNDTILMGGLVAFLGVAAFGFYLAKRSSRA